MVGGGISGLVFSPLAAARAVLSRAQKELGVVLIDIGFGKTGISIYEENKLVHAAVMPIGSGNVTNDLAVGMKCSVAVAEMVKFSFGSALAKEVAARELVDLRKIDPTAKGTVTRRLIAEVIEARLAEIMEFVDGELKRFGRTRKLPAGAIIVGGGAKVPGIVELARQELHLSAQVGIPDMSAIELVGSDLHIQVEDPEFTTAIGLIQIGSDKLNTRIVKPTRAGGFFRNLFKYFIP